MIYSNQCMYKNEWMNVYNMIYDTYIYVSFVNICPWRWWACTWHRNAQTFKWVKSSMALYYTRMSEEKNPEYDCDFDSDEIWQVSNMMAKNRKPYTLSTQQAHTSVLYDLVVAKNLQIGSRNPRPEVALTSAGFHHDSSTPPTSIDGIWWRNP